MTAAVRWKPWPVALLLVTGCDPPANVAPARELMPGPALGLPGPLAMCSDALCAGLANPCQEGWCDAHEGTCRLRATRDGEPCLPGNPCGPAVCRAGECQPLDPPSCASLDAACMVGVCDMSGSGCVARPRSLPGSSCAAAVPLPVQPFGNAKVVLDCGEALRGAELSSESRAYFELDLRAASEAQSVALVVDAAAELEASLNRGPCGDPVQATAGEAFYRDGRSRVIAATLTPDRYWLEVWSTSARALGSVHVASRVGNEGCAAPPANDECSAAEPLDPTIPAQSRFADTACATPSLATRCVEGSAPDLFYELDLSSRSQDVMLDIDLDVVDGYRLDAAVSLYSAPGCSELLACGVHLSQRVSPGVYRLGLTRSLDGSSPTPAFRVGVSPLDCAQATNDTIETALELDPEAPFQGITGNTACGADDWRGCDADRGAPDLFYRLDLRNAPGPRLLQLRGSAASGSLIHFLPQAAGAASLAGLRCHDLADYAYVYTSFTLAPRLYYVVIDGRAQSQGRFDLELELGDAFYSTPRPCLDGFAGDLGSCRTDSEPACADSLASPACLTATVACGLAEEAYATFCRQFSTCCDGSADPETCLEQWIEASRCAD